MENYIVDICIIVPLVWGIVRGCWRGFLLSIGSLIGLVLGIYLSQLFSPLVVALLSKYFVLSQTVAYVLSYLLIFFLIVFLTYLGSHFLSKFAKLIKINWLNRLLGAIFGFIKYTLLISVLLNLITISESVKQYVETSTVVQNSLLYNPVKRSAPTVLPFVKYYVESYGQD